MEKKQQNNSDKQKKQLKDLAKYSGLSFQMLAIILAGVFGGIKLDEYLDTEKPWFTAILTILSVFLALYFALKDLLKSK